MFLARSFRSSNGLKLQGAVKWCRMPGLAAAPKGGNVRQSFAWLAREVEGTATSTPELSC